MAARHKSQAHVYSEINHLNFLGPNPFHSRFILDNIPINI